MIQNEFDSREEVIFIEYDKVIKSSDQFLLHKMGGDLSHVYEEFLDLTDIRGKDMDNCLTLTQMTRKHNLFEALAKVELPNGWYEDYLRLYRIYDNMFRDAHLLDMGESLFTLTNQRFTKKIYFWSGREDKRIVEDIINRHTDRTKMTYVYGDLNEVLNSIEEKITMFVVADLSLMKDIVNYKHIDYTEIMYARYRFNQFRDVDGKLKPLLNPEAFGTNNVKISDFNPYRLQAKHFTQIVDMIEEKA